MKYALVILLALGTCVPLTAMGKKTTTTKKVSKKTSKKAKESFLEKYVDLGDLIISIGRAYKRKKTDAASLSVALLEALNIEMLPLELDDRKTTVGEFFDGQELKECLSEFLTKWFEGKLRKRHIADVLEGLQDSLKIDAVKEEFGDEEGENIEKGFTLLIAHFGGDDVADITEIIDLENAPELFGFILKDYFIIDRLTKALNDALKDKALTKSVLLDCIDIEQIAEREGYDKIPDADGIREAIELFLTILSNNDEASDDDSDVEEDTALHKVFKMLGKYRASKRAAEASSSDDSSSEYEDSSSEDVRPTRRKPTASSSSSSSKKAAAKTARPARSSSSSTRTASRSTGRPQAAQTAREKAEQESADAALARRLQRQWANQ